VHNKGVLDWNDLRYFLAVARHGSTLAAAKALGVSQPTVQRRLAALEHEIGRALVERLPTGYRLTALGADLRAHVERIEEGVAAFERQLAASDQGPGGLIRVTCAEGMAERFLTPLIAAFQARHPGLRVDLMLSDRYLDLAKGEADVAVRAYAPGDDALVARKLSEVPWAVYASRSYVERRGRPAAPEELDRHAVIAFSGDMASNHAGRWLRSVAPNAAVAASGASMLGLVAAVRSGAGLAPLPMMIGEPDDALVCVLGPLPELASRIFLVMHPDLRRAPRVRAFCDFVIAEVDTFRPLLRGKGAAF
jgi:DNA-binding transcriptional LysR family regulator